MVYDSERLDCYLFWLWNYTWRSHKYRDLIIQINEGTATKQDYVVGDFLVTYNYSEGCFNYLQTAESILQDIASSRFKYDFAQILYKEDNINVSVCPKETPAIRLESEEMHVVFKKNCPDISVMRLDLSKTNEQLVLEFYKAISIARWKRGEESDGLHEVWLSKKYGEHERKYESGLIPRAVGLWIWENIQTNGGKHRTIIDAIDSFESLTFFEKLGLGRDPSYYFWLEVANSCIDLGHVLPITKRKTFNTRGHRRSGTPKRK